tara:strand:- start:140 stop:388 length:249 start_codon:yes stop_codon:yes gene_type:complete
MTLEHVRANYVVSHSMGGPHDMLESHTIRRYCVEGKVVALARPVSWSDAEATCRTREEPRLGAREELAWTERHIRAEADVAG